jgi:hypothetical protein
MHGERIKILKIGIDSYDCSLRDRLTLETDDSNKILLYVSSSSKMAASFDLQNLEILSPFHTV